MREVPQNGFAMVALGTFCLTAGVLLAGAAAALLLMGLLNGLQSSALQAGFVFLLGLLLSALGTRLRDADLA